MKILIHYTPRSKSTKMISVLSKKFSLDNWFELLTHSRLRCKHHNEFPELIEKINTTDNICVKINGNDFIDLKNHRIIEDYKNIDYNSFDRIIFLSRKDYVTATLSYGYMNLSDTKTWHNRPGKTKTQRPYSVSEFKIHAMSRAYVMYDHVRDFIIKNVDQTKILEYDFDTVELNASKDFDLHDEDFKIHLDDNNLDYSKLVIDPNKTIEHIQDVYIRMRQLTLQELNNIESIFWHYTEDPMLEPLT